MGMGMMGGMGRVIMGGMGAGGRHGIMGRGMMEMFGIDGRPYDMERIDQTVHLPRPICSRWAATPTLASGTSSSVEQRWAS
jgi:hypothetical protein